MSWSLERVKGIAYALVSSSTFGLIPMFAIPPMREGMLVNSVVFYRFLFSSLAVGAVLLLRGSSLRVNRRELRFLLVLGLLYAATSLVLTSSYVYIPSGTATTIHFLYPVVVSVVMSLVFKERASVFLYVAVVLALCGVYLLSGVEHGAEVNVRGYAMAFSTVLTYACYIIVVNRSCINRMDGLKATFYVLSVGMVIFFFNSLLADGEISGFPDWGSFVHILQLALVATLVSDLTLILAIQRIGSTMSAILGCLEPLTAVCMGALFLGESFTVGQGAGLVAVLAAVMLVICASARGKAGREAATPPSSPRK